MTSNRPANISVVVPVRDEEASIAALIDGLLVQTLRPNEIVIADGGSRDQTREIVKEYIDSGAPVRLITDDDSLPGRSRNLGVTNACNDWIGFIDAGIRPKSDWLAALAEKASGDCGPDVVYGTYEPITDSFFTECAAIAYVPPPVQSKDGLVRPPSIASALMRRDVWRAAGGFPEDLRSAEDLLFMSQVARANFKIARTSRAVVYWHIQPNLWRTFRRFVEYSRNNIRGGLFGQWQGRIFTYYAFLGAATITALSFGVRGFIIPPILWLLFLTMRAIKALRCNRRNYPASPARNLARLSLLVSILAVLDAATFAGSIKWLLADMFKVRQGS